MFHTLQQKSGWKRGIRFVFFSSILSLMILLFAVTGVSADTLTVCASGCDYPTIQAAIDAATSGDTITIAAGTYTESLTIASKYLTLDGSGDEDTIVQGMIDVQAGGADAANRQIIQNLRVSGAGAIGIRLDGDHITLDNVTVENKTSAGVFIYNVSDLIVRNSVFSGNRYGLQVDGKGNASTLVGALITGSQFSGGQIGLLVEQQSGGAGQFENVEIVNTSFSSHTRKGMYFEMMNDVLFNNISVTNSGTENPPEFPNIGIDINLKYGSYDDVEFRDSLISGSGLQAVALDVKARDDGSYSGNPATLTNFRLVRVTVSDNPGIGIRFGEPGKNNAGPTSPVILNSTIVDNTGDGLVNASQANIVAENNWWGCATGPDTDGCETTLVTSLSGTIDADPWLTQPYSPPPPPADDDDTPPAQPPQEQQAPSLSFSSSEVGVQTSGAITTSGNSNVSTTPLVVNGEGNLAAVGDSNLISQGVVQAVDVFAYLPGGVLAQVFDPPLTVCLQGAGTLYFRPAADQTGTFSPAATAGNGSVCITLSEPGMLVLVGTASSASAVSSPNASTGQSIPLTDCQITTDFTLRLRGDSSTSSPVLDRLPVGTSVDASEMVDGWYRVVFGDQQGWVSADYITTSGNCG